MKLTATSCLAMSLVAGLILGMSACGGGSTAGGDANDTNDTNDDTGIPDARSGGPDARSGDGDAAERTDANPATLQLPPANGALDYQLGGAYEPPAGVVVLSRDRNANPAPGIYNICYVNGFQTQPDERSFWTNDHPDLLLRDSSGAPVIDAVWNEIILDVTTPAKRMALALIVGGWIDGCADDGFDAIEIDNLDTYSRSGGRVSKDDAIAFMRNLSDRAHARNLPIAQKNSTEVLDRRADMATDFAVAEECNRYSECGDYTAVYGDQVYVIEYRRSDFNAGCRDFANLSTVLRDRNLELPGDGAYVFDGC